MRRNADEARGQTALRHKGLRRVGAQDLDLIGHLDILRQVKIVKPVFPSQPSDNRVAEVWEARQDRSAWMHREVGTNGVGMPDIEKQGRHSRETEVFD
jgi:hypothetical protein